MTTHFMVAAGESIYLTTACPQGEVDGDGGVDGGVDGEVEVDGSGIRKVRPVAMQDIAITPKSHPSSPAEDVSSSNIWPKFKIMYGKSIADANTGSKTIAFKKALRNQIATTVIESGLNMPSLGVR